MMDRFADLQDHIDRIARTLGCEVRQHRGSLGMMWVEFGRISGPIIEAQKNYLALLHELGHFKLGHTQGRPPQEDKRFYFDNGVLRSEAQAWEWALDHCIEPIEPVSRQFMWDFCLGGYYQESLNLAGQPTRLRNGDRHHVEFVYDKTDDYFASIVQRIQGGLSIFKVPFPDPMPMPEFYKLPEPG